MDCSVTAVPPDAREYKKNSHRENFIYDYTSVPTCYDPGQVLDEPIKLDGAKRLKAEATYNYKPTALRIWFLLLATTFLLVCIAVTEYVLETKPASSEVYRNRTSDLAGRDDLHVPSKGWIGGPWGSNLGPDGKPRARGLPLMDRGDDADKRLFQRVPGSSNFMPSGITTRTAWQGPSSQTREIPTSKTITTERPILVTITLPAETPQDTVKPTPAGKNTQEQPLKPQKRLLTKTDEAPRTTTSSDTPILTTDDHKEGAITSSEDSPNPAVAPTTLVDQTIFVSITEVTRSSMVMTDASGHEYTTWVDKTLVSVQAITTQVVSSLADSQHDRTWTTLVQETITIPAITTQVPFTTTDAFGRQLITSVDTTIPAQTIKTQATQTLTSDDSNDPVNANAANPLLATNPGLETQRRLIGSSATRGTPSIMVITSTQAYATIIPTTFPTLVPGGPAGGAGTAELEVLGLTTAQYFAGAFLPTLLAVVAASLLEVIGTNAKLVQPFQALALAPPGGVSAEASVFLRYDRWMGLLALPHAIRLRQPLVIASQLVVLGSAFLAPLAAEAVSIYTPSSCTALCYGKIAVQRPAAWALEGLMGAVAVLLVCVIVLTNSRGWRTGVNHSPWSIAGMASLCLNRDVRELLNKVSMGEGTAVAEKDMLKVLNGRRYMLDDFVDPTHHGTRYGLVLVDDDSHANHRPLLNAASTTYYGGRHEHRDQPEMSSMASARFSSWLAPLSWWFRGLLVFSAASVLAIVAYYEKSTSDSGFESFMDSRGFGVRFFSTMLGVLLGGLMGAVFDCECFSWAMMVIQQPPRDH